MRGEFGDDIIDHNQQQGHDFYLRVQALLFVRKEERGAPQVNMVQMDAIWCVAGRMRECS